MIKGLLVRRGKFVGMGKVGGWRVKAGRDWILDFGGSKVSRMRYD